MAPLPNATPESPAPRRLFGQDAETVKASVGRMEDVACPVCRVAPRAFAVDYQGFRLCKCPSCGLRFLSPRPSYEDLLKLVYNDGYFSASPGPALPLARHRSRQFQRQLDSLLRISGGKGRILDVGCGDGSFLRFARASGWGVAGCDVRLDDGLRGLDCPLWEGALSSIDFEGERFLAVRFNHVLEHTQDPVAELRHACGIVGPGGLVYASVPNLAGASSVLKSLQSRLHLKNRRWRHYAAVHHLWFFTPRSMRMVLKAAGFRTVRLETPVYGRPGRSQFVESAYAAVLETLRASSILDAYGTPDTLSGGDSRRRRAYL